MARRVFFSFHYDDSMRANQVRNSNVVGGPDVAGFFDHSEYEEAKRQGDEAIRRMILRHLDRTSVTVVLIGTLTASRPWVRYEIEQSVKRQNGLLGIRIHHLKGPLYRGAPPSQWGPSTPGTIPAALPPGTPIYVWDPALRAGFALVIEKAGKRSDKLKLDTTREKVLEDIVRARPRPDLGPPPPPPTLLDALARGGYARPTVDPDAADWLLNYGKKKPWDR